MSALKVPEDCGLVQGMKTIRCTPAELPRFIEVAVSLLTALICLTVARAAEPSLFEAGIAVRDVTPATPIWLAGYAARNKPANQIEHPLMAQAIAFRSEGSAPFVFVALDNCEVNRSFMAPVLKRIETQHGLKPGAVMVVSSHTHSAPVLEGSLEGMYPLGEADRQQILEYCARLQDALVEVVGAALADLQPALLERGQGKAVFATNRRIYRGDQMSFGENFDGPADTDVPVLRIRGTNQTVRAILFGYACHGTSIQGEDFYTVCGDYMAFARQQLENVHPGAVAMFFTGMGADCNPAPRGRLLDAKRHGLELAGAVEGVLDRPMAPVRGPLRWAYEEMDLPFVPCPSKEQLEKDAGNSDKYIRQRAEKFLGLLAAGKPVPKSVPLPMAVVRFGSDLTVLAMGGETVVDYALRLKRKFSGEHLWTIGYAYEVPCYIPSIRILKEGGYEADSSLIYYGFYGPFQTAVEDIVFKTATELMARQ